jgi:hypothetical protein
MAGSYHHLRDAETGLFRFDRIENLRDAYEACEECFFLIEVLSQGEQGRVEAALAEYYRAAGGEAVSPETAARYALLRHGRRIPFPVRQD